MLLLSEKIGTFSKCICRSLSIEVCRDVKDTMLWTMIKSGKFIVNSFHNTLKLNNFTSFQNSKLEIWSPKTLNPKSKTQNSKP